MISKKQKSFDTVKTFRKIKEKISKDISDMSFEEFQAYINKHSLKIELA
jgi:hypothetical protein